MNDKVSIRRHGAVGVILIDNPPVNALSQEVRQRLLDSLHRLVTDGNIKAIVIACAGRSFIAGAEISELDLPPAEPHFPDMMRAISESPKPVVATVHGMALGGGFELVLACHYRVALKASKVGLPEVNIGLIPGAGGTQLLPRVVGLERALDMIASGRPVPVEDLAESGLFDHMVDSDLLAGSIEFASELITQRAEPRKLSDRLIDPLTEGSILFDDWRVNMARKRRGQEAPQRAIDAIEYATSLPYSEAMEQERRMFMELRESAQSRALRHAFFAERAAAKVPGLGQEVEPLSIDSVGVIGAGTMGAGIAMCFASAGYPVVLMEQSADNLLKGIARIDKAYQYSVDRGRMQAHQALECIGRIRGSSDYQDLATVDLVIEAAFENMAVKQEIFRQLDKNCAPGAILATNTSYLDIDQIAGVTSRPGQVLGMHFFSPADRMKLLEVVRASASQPEVLKTAMAVGRRIGKICVAVGLGHGFVGNRMYAAYGREANNLLLEGATPEQVDRAMSDWGMAMGPLAVADLSGIDIGYQARREHPMPPDDPKWFRPADLLVEQGRLGRKSGAGFYSYDAESGKRKTDDSVITLIRDEAARLGVPQNEFSDAEIQQRLVGALVAEGQQVLADGIAARESDIDVIWMNGYGFPRYRGGPMFYAADRLRRM